MAWTIRYTAAALKQLSQLDKQTAKRLVNYLDSRVASSEDPHSAGKALMGNRTGQWRYRVGDYRIICKILYGQLIVEVVAAGHRKDVY